MALAALGSVPAGVCLEREGGPYLCSGSVDADIRTTFFADPALPYFGRALAGDDKDPAREAFMRDFALCLVKVRAVGRGRWLVWRLRWYR